MNLLIFQNPYEFFQFFFYVYEFFFENFEVTVTSRILYMFL